MLIPSTNIFLTLVPHLRITEKRNRPFVDYPSDYNIDASFQLKETNSLTVSILLPKHSNKIKSNCAELLCRLLRECTDLIAESLYYHGHISPNEWRCSRVVPIYKQGKRDCADYYRPISITSA